MNAVSAPVAPFTSVEYQRLLQAGGNAPGGPVPGAAVRLIVEVSDTSLADDLGRNAQSTPWLVCPRTGWRT